MAASPLASRGTARTAVKNGTSPRTRARNRRPSASATGPRGRQHRQAAGCAPSASGRQKPTVGMPCPPAAPGPRPSVSVSRASSGPASSGEPKRTGMRASRKRVMELDIRISLCQLQGVERLLTSLRAAAEPTRLRLLALAARGEFCVIDFTEILGQSQPRLSRHLRLLCEAGLLVRGREGANVWFTLPAGPEGGLVRELLARLPEDDPVLAADRRQAARVLSDRARSASESFRRQGSDWDEMRALDLPAHAVESAILSHVPETGPRR